MIHGWCTAILLRRGHTGWRCLGSGGVGRDFTLGLVFLSLRFSASDGDGMHGAWIGLTMGSSIITRHISRGVQRFSIAERTTEGILGLRARADSKGRWVIEEPIADMRRREEDRGLARERLSGLTMADYQEDFRRGGRAVLAASTVVDSAEAASTAVVDAGSKACGLQAFARAMRLRGQKGRSMSRSAGQRKMMKRKLMWTAAGYLVISMALACQPAKAQQATTASNASPAEQPKGKSFATPGDAAAAIYAAARRNDEAEMLAILGPDAKDIVEWGEDANERREQRAQFAQKYEQMHRLMREPDNTVALYVGAENWPLPIPIVEYKGAWYFDAALGKQEIRYRRIGRNEVEALEVCHALVDAEKEYYANAHAYTAKFISTSDAHDGLYWKSMNDGGRSPIGPYLAHAGVEADGRSAEPFHGYYYRILLQGSDGFAIVAYPAAYRSSGVMTYLMHSDGTAYENDLGEQTATVAKQITSARSNDSWKKVE